MTRLNQAQRPGRTFARPLGAQAGFTLVELMISMVIGLFIVLALLTLLISVNRNNAEMTKTNRVIENGRFSLQLLQADVSHAGFLGGYVPEFDDLTFAGTPAGPTAVPDACLPFTTPWTAAHKSNLVAVPVQSYEIPAGVSPASATVGGCTIANPKAGSDVLFVRHAETCVAGVGDCPALSAGDLALQVSRCTTDTSPYLLDTAGLSLHKRNCVDVAEVRKFVTNLYYVRSYAVDPADGIPTLMRAHYGLSGGVLGFQAPQALIEGVEGFRVELGVDSLSDTGVAGTLTQQVTWADETNLKSPTNRGDGIPDGAYVRCTTASPCTEVQLANTVAVKLYVLVRSENKTAGYVDPKTYNLGSAAPVTPADNYKRHLFTQTVRLTNISSRRETPP